MQKNLKRFALLLVVMVALFTVCLGCLTACDNTSGYSITVVYPDGKAVDGTKDGLNDLDENDKTVSVQICITDASGQTVNCFDGKKLDANGKATLSEPDYTLKEGESFKIQVNNVPDGYKVSEEFPRRYYNGEHVTKPGDYIVTLELA